MSNWGGIGAKNYIGYGVFDLNIRQQDPITDTDVGNLLNFIRNENPHGTGIPEPSLTQMFFSKITLDLSNTHLTIHLPGIGPNDLRKCLNFNPLFLPTAAHIRCYLRSAFRDRKQLFLCLSGVDEDLLKDLRHYTVGVLSMKDRQGKRRGNQGAKIATSHLYPIDQQSGLWQMRVWGYIPTDALPRDNRGRVLVTEAQIIADLQQRLSDPIFWQHCFDDQRIGLSRVDFRRRSAGTSFDDFIQDLVTNP